jgi:hypothetical protein
MSATPIPGSNRRYRNCTARPLAAGKHRKTKTTTGGRGCDDGIGESTILCRVPDFLDNFYIGVARTLAHRNGVFTPRRTRSRAAIFPHPGTLSADGLNVLTRNRIGAAIILQPLHFSVLVRHEFYWG